jgi:citrate lyase subunit beta/citryl-CoA lyase
VFGKCLQAWRQRKADRPPHAGQPVQTAFTPNDEAITYAKRIVETFEANQKEGKGAYSLGGKMIDMPLLKNAQKVLERARAAGK